jgi:hypothetical protein
MGQHSRDLVTLEINTRERGNGLRDKFLQYWASSNVMEARLFITCTETCTDVSLRTFGVQFPIQTQFAGYFLDGHVRYCAVHFMRSGFAYQQTVWVVFWIGILSVVITFPETLALWCIWSIGLWPFHSDVTLSLDWLINVFTIDPTARKIHTKSTRLVK